MAVEILQLKINEVTNTKMASILSEMEDEETFGRKPQMK